MTKTGRISHATAKEVSLAKQISGVTTAALLLTSLCLGQIAVTVSPRSGPPTGQTSVSGSGFSPNARIHIYFDRTYESSTLADGSGSFSNVAIEIPVSAIPGIQSVDVAVE
jgi:hypothetical protein